MNNYSAFDLLMPTYANETYKIYNFLRSIFNYPFINEDEKFNHDDVQGKLYAIAFALTYSSYLRHFKFYTPALETSELILQMKFEEQATELYALANELTILKTEDDASERLLEKSFTEIVTTLVWHHHQLLSNDIKKIFPAGPNDVNNKLFKAIFSFKPELLKGA